MAYEPELAEGLDVPRDNWEFVSSILHEPKAWQSSPSHKEHVQYIDEHPFVSNTFIDTNYFASGDSSQNPNYRPHKTVPAEDKDIFPSNIPPDLDWMEPSTPIRSCAIALSEDDDSSSKTCSDDSREGTEHFSKEKDGRLTASFETETFGADFSSAFLHDMLSPVEALDKETGMVVNDISSTESKETPPWRPHFGAWLLDAKRTSTFCTVALTATVIGLVLIGSGWQRLQLRFQKLRCHFLSKGKGMGQVMYQLVQIKESSSSKLRIPVFKAQNSFPGILNQV